MPGPKIDYNKLDDYVNSIWKKNVSNTEKKPSKSIKNKKKKLKEEKMSTMIKEGWANSLNNPDRPDYPKGYDGPNYMGDHLRVGHTVHVHDGKKWNKEKIVKVHTGTGELKTSSGAIFHPADAYDHESAKRPPKDAEGFQVSYGNDTKDWIKEETTMIKEEKENLDVALAYMVKGNNVKFGDKVKEVLNSKAANVIANRYDEIEQYMFDLPARDFDALDEPTVMEPQEDLEESGGSPAPKPRGNLDAMIKAYLDKGGKITKVPMGKKTGKKKVEEEVVEEEEVIDESGGSPAPRPRGDLDKKVKEYLDKGGKITKVPTGKKTGKKKE